MNRMQNTPATPALESMDSRAESGTGRDLLAVGGHLRCTMTAIRISPHRTPARNAMSERGELRRVEGNRRTAREVNDDLRVVAAAGP